MKGIRKASLVLFAGLAFIASTNVTLGQELYGKKVATSDQIALPSPAEVQNLAVFPAAVSLKGQDDSAQLVVTGNLAAGKVQDLTGDVKYEIANEKLAR